MYLDDGVSRNSAPEGTYFATLPPRHHHHNAGGGAAAVVPPNHHAHGDDAEARSNFRRVDIDQRITTDESASSALQRTITVSTGWDAARNTGDVSEEELYSDEKVKRDVGPEYRVVVWHEDGTRMEDVCVEIDGGERTREEVDEKRKATIVWVPVDADAKTTIKVWYAV